MILRPDSAPSLPGSAAVLPAWKAVAIMQDLPARRYGLVRQPDHARLSGELAKHLIQTAAGPVDDEIVCGIALHDEGWAAFDEGREHLAATPARYVENGVAVTDAGKPVSFLEIKPPDFLRAWRESIEAAVAVGPLAGLIVSGHFCRLGRLGLDNQQYVPDDQSRVREFLAGEEIRACRLMKLQSRTPDEVHYWTDVLQFCDLLSLYLCCGSAETVEFPQRIGPEAQEIRLAADADAFVLSPSPFQKEIELSVPVHRFPDSNGASENYLVWHLR
jgi:hypothetical protein